MVAGAQAHAFYREVAKSGDVWSLGNGHSMLVVMSESGARVFPIWSSRRRAQKIVDIVPTYSGCKVMGCSWDDFLTKWVDHLDRDGVLVGVNWSGPNANGYEMPVRAMVDQVEAARRGDA